MKILHVITSLHTGGAEKLMVDLLPRFKSMGDDVELLLFDGTVTPFYNELEKLGIKIYHLSLGGNVYNPTNIFKVKKYLPRYDIIHTHNTACQYFISIASRLVKFHCHLVTTEHNTTNRRRTLPLFRHIDKLMYRNYSRIIAIARSTAENLRDFIGNDTAIEVIENGIDVSKYTNNDKLPLLPSSSIIISMIAAFREQKDQDTLIKAMTLLPDNVKLRLVGDGERRNTLTNLVKALDLEHRVEFMGVRRDIPSIMGQSHIIVMSSHWEGLSLSSVEGCASGRPLIASDVPGLREVVGGAGILFPDNDYKALANEIKKLIADQTYYDTVVKRCQERAKDYDINVMAKKYNSLYESLLKTNPIKYN